MNAIKKLHFPKRFKGITTIEIMVVMIIMSIILLLFSRTVLNNLRFIKRYDQDSLTLNILKINQTITRDFENCLSVTIAKDNPNYIELKVPILYISDTKEDNTHVKTTPDNPDQIQSNSDTSSDQNTELIKKAPVFYRIATVVYFQDGNKLKRHIQNNKIESEDLKKIEKTGKLNLEDQQKDPRLKFFDFADLKVKIEFPDTGNKEKDSLDQLGKAASEQFAPKQRDYLLTRVKYYHKEKLVYSTFIKSRNTNGQPKIEKLEKIVM